MCLAAWTKTVCSRREGDHAAERSSDACRDNSQADGLPNSATPEPSSALPPIHPPQSHQDSVPFSPTFCFKKDQTTKKFTEQSSEHPHSCHPDSPTVRNLAISVFSLSLYVHIFVLLYLKTICRSHDTSPLNISMCIT